MNNRTIRILGILAVLGMIANVPSVFGQYREYFFYGKVVDTGNKPVADVGIRLRDVATSRGYSVMTNQKGEFKFAGLPHGVYKVSFKKEGFSLKEDEWRFPEAQETMQKVEIPIVTLVSQELVAKTAQLKLQEAAIKAAADKIREKDYDGAIAQLKAFLEKNPEDANALYFLGLGYSRKKMYPEAVQMLTRVSELAPKFAPAYFELGVCYQQQGDLDKSVASYQKNRELDPANADSAYNAGLILFQLGRIAEARIEFEKALTLKPTDPDILEMVSRCCINAGEFAKAIEHLEKAKAGSTNPDKIKFLDDLIGTLKEKIKRSISSTITLDFVEN
jgi:Flp pilus assembly protein TadD